MLQKVHCGNTTISTTTIAICESFNGYLSTARPHIFDQIPHNWSHGVGLCRNGVQNVQKFINGYETFRVNEEADKDT